MNWRSLTVVAAMCAGLIYVLIRSFGHDPHQVPFMLRGKPAPAFSLKRLDNGEEVTLASLRGKPVVINFWASWCGPCKQEHPVLEWGARNYGGQVQFLGVLFEDTEVNARRALSEQGGSSFPQLVDPLSRTAVDYGAAGVPETYFFDASGTIRDKHVGPIPPQILTQQIRALTGASPIQPEAVR